MSGISTEIHLPYYSPTDVSNTNKVKYTTDLGSDTSLIITSNDGFVNLNRINVYDKDYTNDESTNLGTGINDYLYTVMKTNGFKFSSEDISPNNDLPKYLGPKTELNNTITKQLSIDNFDYNFIYGLPTAKQEVIDWNYFNPTSTSKNVFSNTGNVLSNKVENVKIGPRLFYYGFTNDGYQGYGFTNNNTGMMNDNSSTVGNIVQASNTGALSIRTNIAEYYGETVNGISIQASTLLIDLERAWPYKVQPASDQYYQMITNGINTGLLTIPYESSPNQTSYYMLSIGQDSNRKQVIQYSKLDDIVENNYYYITSYFDARPTIQTNNSVYFPSNCASLFNENLVQVLPLMNFNPYMPFFLHSSNASNFANINPVCYTTFNNASNKLYNDQPTTFIPLKWDKNITITTQLNFTCANLTNLSEILTGWNYLPQDFNSDNNIKSRANLPYVNVGLILYFPSQNSNFNYITTNPSITDPAYNNKYHRFVNWLNSFSKTPNTSFYKSIIVDPTINTTVSLNTNNLTDLYDYTYEQIEINNNTATFNDGLSNVACINFNNRNNDLNDQYSDHLNLFSNNLDKQNYFVNSNNTYDNIFIEPIINNGTTNTYETTNSDVIKFYTTLSLPITNALNTTYTMNDTCTFCFTKFGQLNSDGSIGTNVGSQYLADRYYIIGTFIYLTKSLPTSEMKNNPHYIGFAPSTNIASKDLLSSVETEIINNNVIPKSYNYPASILSSFVTDTSNPLSGSYKSTGTSDPDKNPIMKDMFATPSLFMTINESVNNI